MLFDLEIRMRQQANTLFWEKIALGFLGPTALNHDKLEEEGKWSHTHTMLGLDIDSESLRITLPGAKIAVGRVFSDQLGEKAGATSTGSGDDATNPATYRTFPIPQCVLAIFDWPH